MSNLSLIARGQDEERPQSLVDRIAEAFGGLDVDAEIVLPGETRAPSDRRTLAVTRRALRRIDAEQVAMIGEGVKLGLTEGIVCDRKIEAQFAELQQASVADQRVRIEGASESGASIRAFFGSQQRASRPDAVDRAIEREARGKRLSAVGEYFEFGEVDAAVGDRGERVAVRSAAEAVDALAESADDLALRDSPEPRIDLIVVGAQANAAQPVVAERRAEGFAVGVFEEAERGQAQILFALADQRISKAGLVVRAALPIIQLRQARDVRLADAVVQAGVEGQAVRRQQLMIIEAEILQLLQLGGGGVGQRRRFIDPEAIVFGQGRRLFPGTLPQRAAIVDAHAGSKSLLSHGDAQPRPAVVVLAGLQGRRESEAWRIVGEQQASLDRLGARRPFGLDLGEARREQLAIVRRGV